MRAVGRPGGLGRLGVHVGIACAASLVVLAGCTTKHYDAAPSPSPSADPTITAPASSAPPVSPSASAASPVLPTACSQLLPLGTLERIVGFGVLGQVNYLRAAPVPKSGRTGRVTCTYGNPAAPVVYGRPSPSPTGPAVLPLAQASYITYVDAKTAAARVQTTVEADGATAVVTETTVDGKPANILVGSASSELLMSDGARTIVVVVSAELVNSAKAAAALKAIAESMLAFGRPSPSASVVASSSASGTSL
jgi:hypothetical protein